MNFNSILQSNIRLLGDYNPVLANRILSDVTSASIDGDNVLVCMADKNYSFSLARSQSDFDNFLSKPSKISFMRTYNAKKSPNYANLTTQLFDKHNNSLVEALPNLSIPMRQCSGLESPISPNSSFENSFRDYMILGAINFIPFSEKLLSSDDPIQPLASLTIVESSISALVAFLSKVSLQNIQNFCKSANIGFQLIFNEVQVSLQEAVFFHFYNTLPCSTNGLYVISGSQNDSCLIQLNGWLFSQIGFHYRFFTALGTSSDELNQLREALLNYISRDMVYLKSINPPESYAALIVASGPSLDDHLDWIHSNQDHFFIIAAGSSVGSLLEKNVRVDMCVQLERGTGVYDDMRSLMNIHPELADTCLVSSSTSDPNLSCLFKNRVFFHRPIATASCIFEGYKEHVLPHAGPEAANAALEVGSALGFKSFVLCGCDFASRDLASHRASNAAGISPRKMNTPVRGSLNRTVYTDFTLSLVRDVFENTIRLLPDSVFYRLGEGLPIANTLNISPSDLSPKFFAHSCSAAEYMTRVLKNSTKSKPADLNRFFAYVSESCCSYYDSIDKFLDNESSWSISMHRKFSNLLCAGNDDTCSPSELIVQRYMRQLLFAALQPLYHAKSPASFVREKELFMESIKYGLDYLIITVTGVLDYSKRSDLKNSSNQMIAMEELSQVISETTVLSS